MIRHISTRSGLNIGVAALALVAAPTFGQSAPAADAPAAVADDDSSEVIVTARRREETLLDVPIAVTAYSGAQLERSGAIDITDLSNTTPNVTLEASRATNSTLTAFIRGVGQQDPVSGFEQGVGIYLDDVYLNRPQASVLDIYDVERIEVLRGPQGTLYGRNTVGGAVKYVTKRLPAEAEMNIRGSYGMYNQLDGVISISAPVGDGTLRFGGALAGLNRDGFGKNLTTGLDNYNKKVLAARFTAEVHATNFFGRFTADYTRDRSNPRNGHRVIPAQLSNAPVLDDVYDTRGGLLVPEQRIKGGGGSLYLEAKPTEGITFRSITAYRKDDSYTPIDFDALASADLDVPGIYKNKQFSQELQLLIDKGQFSGLIGAYYLDASALTQFDVRLFTTSPGFSAFTNADVKTKTGAIFGDFTYDFTDQLSVSVGGRYTWDERQAYILRQNYLGGGAAVFGGLAIPFGAPATNFRGESTFKKFTPRASMSFKPTPEHNIYASYSKGFKGGGFDPRGVGANAPAATPGAPTNAEVADFLSFAPESVDSYEIGYKASLFDRRLTMALAAFRADYKDVQIPGSVGCVSGGVQTFCGVVSNAGKARFQGFEAEATARLGGGFSVAGTLGYIDAKYREYFANIIPTGQTQPVPTNVAAFREVQNTPNWTTSVTPAYTVSLDNGARIDASATWSYRSKTYQFEIPNPYIDQKGYSLFDANLVYRADGGRWSIGLHAKNLLDKQYKTSGYTFVATNPVTGEILTRAAATPVATCGTPRTIPAGSTIPSLGCESTLTTFYGNPRQIFGTFTVKF